MFHLSGQLRKSAAYRLLEAWEPRANHNDLQLMLATVGRSRDLLAVEYPGAEFHVILWPEFGGDQKMFKELESGLASLNIPVHLVEKVLPGYGPESTARWEIPLDGHPNPQADKLLAKYIVDEILPSARTTSLQ